MKAIAIAALGMLVAPSALADLVVRVHNQSNVEAKGMVQNHPPIMWLKRGQVNDIRLRGKWVKDIKGDYTVNFENLSNAGHQYCVWKVHVLFPANSKGEKFSPKDIGGSLHVKLDVKLEQSDPNFQCEVRGQFTGRVRKSTDRTFWESFEKNLPWLSTDDQGATLDFALKSK